MTTKSCGQPYSGQLRSWIHHMKQHFQLNTWRVIRWGKWSCCKDWHFISYMRILECSLTKCPEKPNRQHQLSSATMHALEPEFWANFVRFPPVPFPVLRQKGFGNTEPLHACLRISRHWQRWWCWRRACPRTCGRQQEGAVALLWTYLLIFLWVNILVSGAQGLL